MTEPRLASHILVSAFVRLANAQGDFATVIKKGDPVSGSLLLIGQIRGEKPMLFERMNGLDGVSSWQPIYANIQETVEKMPDYLTRRKARDPDLWIVELDVADGERLNGLLAASY